jgi:iron complex outermembrane recepter protein
MLPSNSPSAIDGNISVRPGDHIPGVPAHRLKVGLDYSLTDAWKIGADVVAASSQYYIGDESNQNDKLSGYAVVNLHSSYQLTKKIQIYGIVNNVFDHKYATYGTYFENDAVGLDNPRMITPAQPLSVYGGVKIKFPGTTALE